MGGTLLRPLRLGGIWIGMSGRRDCFVWVVRVDWIEAGKALMFWLFCSLLCLMERTRQDSDRRRYLYLPDHHECPPWQLVVVVVKRSARVNTILCRRWIVA